METESKKRTDEMDKKIYFFWQIKAQQHCDLAACGVTEKHKSNLTRWTIYSLRAVHFREGAFQSRSCSGLLVLPAIQSFGMEKVSKKGIRFSQNSADLI